MYLDDLFGPNSCCCFYFQFERTKDIYSFVIWFFSLIFSAYKIEEYRRWKPAEQSDGPLCVSGPAIAKFILLAIFATHQTDLLVRIVAIYFKTLAPFFRLRWVPVMARGVSRFIQDPLNLVCIGLVAAISFIDPDDGGICPSSTSIFDGNAFCWWASKLIAHQHNRNLTITSVDANTTLKICSLMARKLELEQKCPLTVDDPFFCLINTQNCSIMQVCPLELLVFIIYVQFSLFAYNWRSWKGWMGAKLLPKGQCFFLFTLFSTQQKELYLMVYEKSWKIGHNLAGFTSILNEYNRNIWRGNVPQNDDRILSVAHEMPNHGIFAVFVIFPLYERMSRLIEKLLGREAFQQD